MLQKKLFKSNDIRGNERCICSFTIFELGENVTYSFETITLFTAFETFTCHAHLLYRNVYEREMFHIIRALHTKDLINSFLRYILS